MSLSTRRTFLQLNAAAATGIVAQRIPAIASSAPTKIWRVGIIGATGRGDYGHAVDMAFKKLPEVRIVSLADSDPKGLDAAAKRLQPDRVFANYREMLTTVPCDIVAICPRWIDQHYDMLLAAIDAGCHVYMEKPFCPTLEQCDRVLQSLREKKLKLAIAHTGQYSPTLQAVRKIIADGAIGELIELRGRGKEDRRGGGEDLWVLGSHIFGLIRAIAGENATSCSSIVKTNGKPICRSDVVEGAEGIGPLAGDHVHASYTFNSEVIATFGSRRGLAGAPSRFALQVFGSKGMIELESGFLAPAHLLRDSSWSPGRSSRTWETITSQGIGQTETRTDRTYEDGHIAAIRDLFEAIDNDRDPICSAHDAAAITEMIVAVFESARKQSTVALPLQSRVNPLTLLD